MTQLRHFAYRTETAAANMAMDSLMLERSIKEDAVLWRFYGWSEAAVTFGYSQRWTWVLENSPERTAAHVRRWTGGGIVDHRNDFTYALSIPASDKRHRSPALEVYEELHGLIADVLETFEIAGALAPCPGNCSTPPLPGRGICFQAPEPYDVIDPANGAKLAGAAMKRHRDGLLIQGSLNLHENSDTFRTQFAGQFGKHLAGWLQLPESRETGWPGGSILSNRTAQYASREWNEKR